MWGRGAPPSLLWRVTRDLTLHFKSGIKSLSFCVKGKVRISVGINQVLLLKTLLLVTFTLSCLIGGVTGKSNLGRVHVNTLEIDTTLTKPFLNFTNYVFHRCQIHSKKGIGTHEGEISTSTSVFSDPKHSIQMGQMTQLDLTKQIYISEEARRLNIEVSNRSKMRQIPVNFTPEGGWLRSQRNKGRKSNIRNREGEGLTSSGAKVYAIEETVHSIQTEEDDDQILIFGSLSPRETSSVKKRRQKQNDKRGRMKKGNEEMPEMKIFSGKKRENNFHPHLPFSAQRDLEGGISGASFESKLPQGESSKTTARERFRPFQVKAKHLHPPHTDSKGQSSNLHRQKRKADMHEVWVLEGSLAELPCDLNVTHPKDSVQLILWIKEGIHTPLYSYDYRELQGGRPKEMKPDVNSTMAQRTSFRTDKYPPALLVENVEAEDAGIYRCRGDFSLSPTINRRINLTVVVPPHRVRIRWQLGEKDFPVKDAMNGVAGPFLENSQPTFICSNDDGWPLPSLTWHEKELLLDDTYDTNISQGIVENEFTLNRLTRSDLGRQLTCLATNTNSAQPAVSTITIDMTLTILGVEVQEVGRLWAGDRTEVECTVWGSRPTPTIVWWLGPAMKVQTEIKKMDEGNLTISVLSFTPSPKEDEVMLICQATNDDLPSQAVQDSSLLSVNYAPVVDIRLGPSLDPERIKEGDDVYFECPVRAKPSVFNIVWRHNGLKLSEGEGVLVTNMTLVLQRVTRGHAGNYSCEATNVRNTTLSLPIYLDVKYTPICVQGNKSTYAVARREHTVVTCQVNANPAIVSFTWSFNNSAEAVGIPDDRFVVYGTESKVNYSPVEEIDYGTLQCRANNSIGMQTIPCLYKIIPAGKPDPPHHCRMSEVTISSLQVSCLPGDDGGLNQTFLLKMYHIGEESKRPLAEVNQSSPSFSVGKLRPATPYRIVISAVNKIGPSRTVELKTYTARLPETQQETNAEPTRDREQQEAVPLVALVGGGGVVLMPLIVVVAVLVRLKFGRPSGGTAENGDRKDGASYRTASSPSHSPAIDTPSSDLLASSEGIAVMDESDPDLLSHTPAVHTGETDTSHPKEGDSQIATLTPSVYITGEIQAYAVKGHPLSHPPVSTTAIAESQVPYYPQTPTIQHKENVAVLSTSSFAQGQSTSDPSTLVQGVPPSLDFNSKQQQQPYPFPHICQVGGTGSISKQNLPRGSSPQYCLLSQFPHEIQVSSEDQRLAVVVTTQGGIQRQMSKMEDVNRPPVTIISPVPPTVVTSDIKGESLHQQIPVLTPPPPPSRFSPSTSGRNSETTKQQKDKGKCQRNDGRSGDVSDVRLESTV